MGSIPTDNYRFTYCLLNFCIFDLDIKVSLWYWDDGIIVDLKQSDSSKFLCTVDEGHSTSSLTCTSSIRIAGTDVTYCNVFAFTFILRFYCDIGMAKYYSSNI